MHKSHPDDNWKEIDRQTRKINTDKILSLRKGPLFSADDYVKKLYKKKFFKEIISKKFKVKKIKISLSLADERKYSIAFSVIHK